MGEAIWWGVQTITSLGYGSVLPQTTTGKILSGFVALIGLIAFAIPAGIISSRFAIIARSEREGSSHEEERRDSSSTRLRDRTRRKLSVFVSDHDVYKLRSRVRVLSKTLTSVTEKLRREKNR